MVRNFYVEADIDGRQTILGGGPKSHTGGMTVSLHQRCEGEIQPDVIKIVCRERDGKLFSDIYVGDKLIHTNETTR